MSATFMESPAIGFRWEPKWPFAVLLVYQDPLTRARALWLYEQLRIKRLAQYNLRCSRWGCDQLLQPDQSGQATEDALGADMIILSLHGQSSVPAGLQGWINGWLHLKNGRDCALVTLFDRDREERRMRPTALRFFRKLARCTHMSFFFRFYPTSVDVHPANAPSHTPPERRQCRATARSHAKSGVETYPRRVGGSGA